MSRAVPESPTSREPEGYEYRVLRWIERGETSYWRVQGYYDKLDQALDQSRGENQVLEECVWRRVKL